MKLFLQSLMTLATIYGCLIGSWSAALANEPTTEDARASLKKQSFPWYDSASDDFRPLDPVAEAPEKISEAPQQPVSLPSSSLAGIQNLLLWALLIAVFTVVVIIAVRTWQDANLPLSEEPRPTADISLEALEALPEPVRKVQDLLGEATRLAAESQFAAAILFYYSWQLVQLDRQQLIELQKGKTNRQYQRELSESLPELLTIFSPSLRFFEDSFFGQLPIAHDDFMEVWEQQNQFQFKSRGGRS